jgi:hypothetical protein
MNFGRQEHTLYRGPCKSPPGKRADRLTEVVAVAIPHPRGLFTAGAARRVGCDEVTERSPGSHGSRQVADAHSNRSSVARDQRLQGRIVAHSCVGEETRHLRPVGSVRALDHSPRLLQRTSANGPRARILLGGSDGSQESKLAKLESDPHLSGFMQSPVP